MQSFLNHSQGVKSDLPHLVEMLSEEYLEYLSEGGRSSEIQFNSEIGPLLAFCERKPLDLSPEETKQRRLKQMREACARYRVRLRSKNSLTLNKDVVTSEHKGLDFSCNRQECKTAKS